MRLVIDANVAIKWVIAEPDSATAFHLRRHELIAPDLILAEMANILIKKVRTGGLPAGMVPEAMALLLELPIRTHPLGPLALSAVTMARDLDHPAYDLFYAALAVQENIPFITADRRLVNRVQDQQPAWAALVQHLSHASLA